MLDVERSILFETVNMITCANVLEMPTVRSADTWLERVSGRRGQLLNLNWKAHQNLSLTWRYQVINQ